MTSTNTPIRCEADLLPFLSDSDTTPSPAIVTAADIPSVYDVQVSPITFLVQGLIARNAMTLLTSESGAGKSTLTHAIAGAVSHGKEIAGLSTIQSPVLYLDRENTLPIVQERFERLGLRDGDQFKYYGNWVAEGPPSLDDPFYLNYILSCKSPPLIIVDSFIAFHAGNENDSTETRKFLDQMRRWTNLGAAVMILHHVGKSENAKQFRGSSDIVASVDLAYKLTNSGGERLEKLTLKSFKSRFTALPSLALNYHDGVFTSAEPGKVSLSSPHQPKLMQLLRENPGILSGNFEELTRISGIPRSKVREFLKAGVNEGWIQPMSKGTNGKSYRLVDLPSVSESIM